MKRVTGVGGVFFRAKNPAALHAWYKEHLGLPVGEDGNTIFLWREAEDSQMVGMTAWAAFPADTEYFGKSGQQWMIDYRVDDLDALLEQLQREGVEVVPHREAHAYGKFGWIIDLEGNRIELWEPPKDATPPGHA